MLKKLIFIVLLFFVSLTTFAKVHPDPNYPEVTLPPAWAFGVMYGVNTNQSDSMDHVNKLIRSGYPIDAIWLDSWFWNHNQGKGPKGYLDFMGDMEAYPKFRDFCDQLESKGIKTGIWIWDAVQDTGNEDIFNALKDKGYFAKISVNKDDWHNKGGEGKTQIGEFDFSNQVTREIWKKLVASFFDEGLDFLRLDRSDDIDFCSMAFEFTQELGKETKGRGFILARIDSLENINAEKLKEIHRYPARWTGDTNKVWSCPIGWPKEHLRGGLKETIEMVVNPVLPTSKIPFLAHDATGTTEEYTQETSDTYGGSDYRSDLTDELYVRWIQFACFSPIFEVFSSQDRPIPSHLPHMRSEQVQPFLLNSFQFRMKLFPYIYSYAHLTRQQGKYLIQSDGVHHDQYLFGDSMLIAPICEKGSVIRSVYLPKGETWINYYTQQEQSGGQNVIFVAQLGVVPIYIKKGSIIPMREYARSIELGSNQLLILDTYPDEKEAMFVLYEDDGVSNEYREGRYTTTEMRCVKSGAELTYSISAARGDFDGMLSHRNYQIKLNQQPKPKKVTFNYEILYPKEKLDGTRGWVWDENAKILWIEFVNSTVRSSNLVVSFE